MRSRMGALLIPGVLLFVTPAFAQTSTAQTPPSSDAPVTPLLPAPSKSTVPSKPAVAFPPEARVAFINMQTIFGDSNLGKQGVGKLKALNDQLSAGLAARDKEIQGLSEKIRTQQGIVSSQLAVTWNKDLERLQREAQFARQEAQVQVEQFQQELLSDFQATVQPVIEAVRADRGLWIILAIENDGSPFSIAAAHPGVDLSAEVVKRLNAGK